MSTDPYGAEIGMDWADQKHDIALYACAAATWQERSIKTRPQDLLVQEKIRLTNRIMASLKSYFPQVLDWFEAKDTSVFCEFLQHFPKVQSVPAATPQPLTQFFPSHQVVRKSAIARRIEQIQDAGPPLT